jgi:hypothetical protein
LGKSERAAGTIAKNFFAERGRAASAGVEVGAALDVLPVARRGGLAMKGEWLTGSGQSNSHLPTDKFAAASSVCSASVRHGRISAVV